jgi:TRAP-type uncharacterized transport system substrate-binding protein
MTPLLCIFLAVFLHCQQAKSKEEMSMIGRRRQLPSPQRNSKNRSVINHRAPRASARPWRRVAGLRTAEFHDRSKIRSGSRCGKIIAAAIVVAGPNLLGFSADAARYAAARYAAAAPAQAGVNRGVVELETGRASGISVQIAEDIANVLDDGATRRVLPIVGKGGLANITDLNLLHGIDLAIVQDDVLDYARRQNLFPGIEYRITYAAKLYNEEFHLLARGDIKTVADLANQKVNVDLRGGGTEVTAARLFGLLNIPIVTTNDDPGVALEKLRRGEIAAIAFVAGKPAPIFRGLIGENNLHFLPIPLNPAVTAAYAPARLTANEYPALIQYNQPVDTVAVATVLMVANLQPDSDRYRNVVNFVDAFFTRFQSLLTPGHQAKWSEVNIAAELPGWRRFGPAADWLQRNAPTTAGAPTEQDLKAIFARFIDERQQAAGGVPLTPQQKDDLFGQFQRWEKGQAH